MVERLSAFWESLTLGGVLLGVGLFLVSLTVSFVAIAIVQATGETTPPCGRCLQLLAEFADDMAVLTDGPEGPQEWRLKDLLPRPFRRARLEES